jgi:uncharacterized protein YqgC (DUF456 family)
MGGGVAGTVVPVLPGTPMIFAGIAIIAWWYDFTIIGAPTLIVTGILAVTGLAVDFVASALGAKKVGASKQAIIGASLGSFFGIFLGIPGIIFGPFVGAIIGELLANEPLSQATKVGVGTWLGRLLGSAAKVAIALAMLGVFLIALVWQG